MIESRPELRRSGTSELVFAYPTSAELQAFTRPKHDKELELKMLYQLGEEFFPKKRNGLVIGRFQPLHYGHIYNWKMALAVADSIAIAIGSANKTDNNNPFSAKARERMVKDALAEHNLTHRVSAIVHINDHDSDDVWLKETLSRTGDVDVVVGNNSWVNGIFEASGRLAVSPPLLERGMYEGEKCRTQLRLEGKLPPLQA